MNILHKMDRLSRSFMPTPTKQITASDITKIFRAAPAILELQDEVERLNMVMEDQIEATRVAKDIADRTSLRNAELAAQLESERLMRQKFHDAEFKANQFEHENIKLKEDLKIEIQNRDHFRNLVAQQDKFVAEAKKVVIEQRTKIDAEKTNSEHLARQVLKFKEENDRLKTYALDTELAAKVPTLLEENRKFREQTTRLLEEKRILEEERNSLEKLVRECEHASELQDKTLGMTELYKDTYMKVCDFQHTAIEQLKQTLKPFATNFMGVDRKPVRDAFLSLRAIGANIDHIFEDFRAKLQPYIKDGKQK